MDTRKEACKGVALAGATLLLALLAVEAGLAIADYPPAYTDHQQLFVEYDSLRGWRNIPNAHRRYVTPEFAVELDYNAHAYRGPLVSYDKPAGTSRVVLLGDSFLEGYTVPLQERIAEVAARHLPQVQIIALGTGGYSTDQELIWLQTEGLRYSPDIVVLLFCSNDIWFNNRASYPRGAKPLFRQAGDTLALTNVPVPRVVSSVPARPRSLKRFIVEHSRLARLVERARRRSPGLLQPTAAQLPDEFQPFADTPNPAADSAIRMTEKLLAQMRQRVSAAGARLVVMLVPSNDALYPPGAPQSARFKRTSPFGDPNRVSERFAGICARAGVTCVDPTPRFIAAAESLATNDQLLIFREDEHWNEEGHRVAASVLADIVSGSTLPRSLFADHDPKRPHHDP